MSLINGTQYIQRVKQHYEALDEHGNFLCSGDSEKECFNELVEMIKQECAAGAKQSA